MDLQAALREAQPGAVLTLPAGRYGGNFFIDKPVTLLASGQVVLDGLKTGSVLRIETDGLVRLSGLMIVGGAAPEGNGGGGICAVHGRVELSDCTLRYNQAPTFGGGGLYAQFAQVQASRCRFEGNTGRQGGAVLADGESEVTLRDCAVIQNAAVHGGALRAMEGARVGLHFCTLADNKAVGDQANGSALHVQGSTTRQPQVTVTNSVLSERAQGVPFIHSRGTLSVTRSLLPEWSRVEGDGNLFGDPKYVLSGNEPYLPAEGSPLIGAADVQAAATTDVNGQARMRNGKADLGAFAFIAKSGGIGY